MQIIVTGRHFDLTDPIRQYAEEKCQKLSRYYDRVSKVEVVADRQGQVNHELEIICYVDRHDPFIAKAVHEDLYACIDEATDKMTRQLHDHKQKVRDNRH